ncbi:hypothetical protein CN128_09900 [Sinorhizobium meliloti]|nr:hypothetical protein CN128_09900 [Sinorhizobium meliloti]
MAALCSGSIAFHSMRLGIFSSSCWCLRRCATPMLSANRRRLTTHSRVLWKERRLEEYMPRTMTLQRASNKDLIKIPVWIIHPIANNAALFHADFDTGNDHTCVHPRVLHQVGARADGRHLPVHGVAGGAMAQVATVSIGFQMDDGHRITVTSHEVAVLPLTNCDILLGRDMLDWCDVSITRGGVTIITFG